MRNESRLPIILLVALGISLSAPAIAGLTTSVNGRPVALVDSTGAPTAYPDVCRTPSPAGPIPVPYPNIADPADSSKGTKKVKVEGKTAGTQSSRFSVSTGDEPGTVGGIVSSKVKGKAEFVLFSSDVKVEGKSAARAFDIMLHNDKNTPPMPVLRGPIVTTRGADAPTPEELMVDPSQLEVMVTDDQGNRRRLRKSKLFELEDGSFCAVCMKKKRVTRILRLYVDTPPQ